MSDKSGNEGNDEDLRNNEKVEKSEKSENENKSDEKMTLTGVDEDEAFKLKAEQAKDKLASLLSSMQV